MPADLIRLTTALTGRYRVEREVGAGGMAMVYLAYDARHDRRVALKVLRSELAAVIGAERFLHEIKTTANLQHPHILALFDSGEVDGTVFYVMPFVEGESLRDRLHREKQLPVDEAIRIAREVADALDYAHRHGVVHRDIKPENILLHDGRAVVADFGIALAVSRSEGVTRMTETGMSLGTPHYMSPEQAMGEREITARSDVYALGAVLYEMLAGEPPFTGPTAQAIVARVVTESPRSLTAQRPTVPPHVDRAVRRALQKLPADRFQTAAQFAEAITKPGAELPLESAADGPISLNARSLPRFLRHPAFPWGVAAALLMAVIALSVRGTPDRSSSGSMRFAVDLDLAQGFPSTAVVLVTPDGQTVITDAIVAQKEVLIARRLDRMDATVIAGSDIGQRPFLSHDGRFVAFSANSKLMKVPIEGGTPVQFGESSWGGGAWNSDGIIAFSKSYQSGLWSVNEAGGNERKLTDPDSTKGELAHWWPQWLPGNKTILFTAYRTPVSKASIEALDVATGRRTVLIDGGVMPRYLPTGHLLFARDETVLAVPFDAGSLEVKGAPTVVLEGVYMNFSDGYASWDVSATGTLAFITTTTAGTRTAIVAVDRRGVERALVPTPDRYESPRWAPDGRRISFDLKASRLAADVWVYDPDRGGRVRITSDEAADFGAVWTPDGTELIYMSERPLFELYRRAAGASRPAEPLLTGTHDRITGAVAPNGILAYLLSLPAVTEIWTVPYTSPDRASRYLANGFKLGHPMLSPDGRWMAYDSNEGGRMEVFLQSYPDPTKSRVQVSSDGGGEPVWSRGGRELAFRRGDTVMVVAVDVATGSVSHPVVLFSGPYAVAPDWTDPRSYDVAADGERFLMLRLPAGSSRARVNVVTKWFDELRTKVPR